MATTNFYEPTNVLSGTFGYVYINGMWLAEGTALEAKVTLKKEAVSMAGVMYTGYKVTGYEGKGTIKLNKVSSYFIDLLSAAARTGKTNHYTIMSQQVDPGDHDAASGASAAGEIVTLTGVIFDEITLAGWEVGKLTEESVGFTFTDWTLDAAITNLNTP